ncbi:MAG: hypothetical protein ABIQ02_00675 [Saprospiraceae bacterium]
MKTSILNSILFTGTAILFFSFTVPTGWFQAGSDPEKYDMGTDKGAGPDGKNAATIKSIAETIKGFGTLMQNCSPDHYTGKRIRMSGYMKSNKVQDWAGFWLRIDSKNGTGALGFDNMQNRAVKGTTDWLKYEIVLDVPEDAYNIGYGALLSGTGQIWFDDMKIEIVDHSVSTTNLGDTYTKAPVSPVNLSFEEE